MTVGEVSKSPVVTAHPDETILEVARRMREHHVGDVVVADSQHRPIGMLTDRDIVVSAVAQSSDRIQALLVGDVMTREPVTARPTEDLHAALDRMRTSGIRRLPVVGSDGQLEGILTFDDILKVMSLELSELIGLVAREQKQERVSRP
jgi:CBS domain-containing protein